MDNGFFGAAIAVAFLGIGVLGTVVVSVISIPANTTSPPKQALTGLLALPALLASVLLIAVGGESLLVNSLDYGGGGEPALLRSLGNLIQLPGVALLLTTAAGIWAAALIITVIRILSTVRDK